jgi:hypothetical protein
MEKIDVEFIIPELAEANEDTPNFISNYNFNVLPIIGDTIIVEDFINEHIDFEIVFKNHPVAHSQVNDFIIYKREFMKGGKDLSVILYCKTAELYFSVDGENRYRHIYLKEVRDYIAGSILNELLKKE